MPHFKVRIKFKLEDYFSRYGFDDGNSPAYQYAERFQRLAADILKDKLLDVGFNNIEVDPVEVGCSHNEWRLSIRRRKRGDNKWDYFNTPPDFIKTLRGNRRRRFLDAVYKADREFDRRVHDQLDEMDQVTDVYCGG